MFKKKRKKVLIKNFMLIVLLRPLANLLLKSTVKSVYRTYGKGNKKYHIRIYVRSRTRHDNPTQPDTKLSVNGWTLIGFGSLSGGLDKTRFNNESGLLVKSVNTRQTC